MWREIRIFAHRQSSTQILNSKTEATFYPLWSVDSRGAGQLSVCLSVGKYYHLSPHPPLSPLVWNSKKFAVLNKKLLFPE